MKKIDYLFFFAFQELPTAFTRLFQNDDKILSKYNRNVKYFKKRFNNSFCDFRKQLVLHQSSIFVKKN